MASSDGRGNCTQGNLEGGMDSRHLSDITFVQCIKGLRPNKFSQNFFRPPEVLSTVRACKFSKVMDCDLKTSNLSLGHAGVSHPN